MSIKINNRVYPYHAKAVQGLYIFAHWEREDGAFIQAHLGGRGPWVHSDGVNLHSFDSYSEFVKHIEESHQLADLSVIEDAIATRH